MKRVLTEFSGAVSHVCRSAQLSSSSARQSQIRMRAVREEMTPVAEESLQALQSSPDYTPPVLETDDGPPTRPLRRK